MHVAVAYLDVLCSLVENGGTGGYLRGCGPYPVYICKTLGHPQITL